MRCETLKEIDELDGIVEYPLVMGPFHGSQIAIGGFFSRPGLPQEITLTWANQSTTYALRALRGLDGQLGDLIYRFQKTESRPTPKLD